MVTKPKSVEDMTPDEKEAENVRRLHEAIEELKSGILTKKNRKGKDQLAPASTGEES